MDPRFPLIRLTLVARSVSDDLSFVALHDVAETSRQLHLEHRLIGAHMVTLHAYRWGLGAELYRETRDVDLGIPLEAARDPAIIERLELLGYRRVAGNRLARPLSDIPVRVESGTEAPMPEAAVDILVPAYTSRPRQNLRVGNHLTTTEVRGLAEAFLRPPVEVNLELTRLNGSAIETSALLPDETSLVILRALAWQVRGADTDAVDLWRSLEIAARAGLQPGDFASEVGRSATKILRSAILATERPVIRALTSARGLSDEEARRSRTRLRALASRVTGARHGT